MRTEDASIWACRIRLPRWLTAQIGFWRWVWPEFGMRLTMMENTLAG
jgi:hypothetical protein